MEPRNDQSGSESAAAYQEVVRILKKKSWSRRAERIVGLMCGFEDVVASRRTPAKTSPSTCAHQMIASG
jgi:hypothetical protein